MSIAKAIKGRGSLTRYMNFIKNEEDRQPENTVNKSMKRYERFLIDWAPFIIGVLLGALIVSLLIR